MNDDLRLDQQLDQRLAALTREHAPDPALWHGIEARLRPRHRSRLWAIAASAAGLALVLAAIAPMFQPAAVPGPGELTIRAELKALQQLEPTARPAGWTDNAGLAAAWQDNQTAIAELEQALERSPGNRMLLDFLAEARLRQARLLGQNTVERSIPNPTERSIDT